MSAANRKLTEAQKLLIIGGGPVGIELAGEIITDYPTKKVSGFKPTCVQKYYGIGIGMTCQYSSNHGFNIFGVVNQRELDTLSRFISSLGSGLCMTEGRSYNKYHGAVANYSSLMRQERM